MKIILVNKFYYNRGGDCVVALSIEKLLKTMGHEVAFFSMDYKDNFPSEWSTYFAPNIRLSGGGILGKVTALNRILNGTGAKERFSKLIDDFKPDVVHLHNIHSYLSPALAKVAHNKGVKVVWTLHDYKLICPSYSFLRNGQVCEECLLRTSNVLTHKCMKNSLLASAMAYVEALRWQRKQMERWTDVFICPSKFMADKMKEGGFSEAKLEVLCNFIDPQKIPSIQSIEVKREDAYCYVGRLSEEKGIQILLQAAVKNQYPLYVAGDGPLSEQLRNEYTQANIHFLGRLSHEEVVKLLKKVRFMVIPSICYENNPLSVIESLCCGTPVLGSRMGGIPELLSEDTCVSFDVGKVDVLVEAISLMMQKSKAIDNFQLSQSSLQKFSAENYYKKLLQIYS